MAGVPEKVLNWLYSVLTSEYKDVNRTYHDAAEALSNYPSLSPRTEVYTHENGASALLLLLSGTLPVTFRGATYGFPVAIWVPHAYPREPPMVYVTPSQDMIVRPGQHVSGDGRIYHPYLAQWAKYWDKSTLFDFLAVLRGVFAKEPPVRSRQQQKHYNAPAQQAPPPVPPPPAEWRRSVQGAAASTSSPGPSQQGQGPPPRPPKPGEQTPQPTEDRYSRPPPLPPHPPQQPTSSSQYQPPPRPRYDAPPEWQQQGPPPTHNGQRQPGYDVRPQSGSGPPPRPHVQAQGYPPNQYESESPVSPMTPQDQRTQSRYVQPLPQPQQQHAQGPPPQQYQQPQQYAQQPPQSSYQQAPPPGYAPQTQSQQHPQYQPPFHQQRQQQQPQPTAPQPPVNLMDDSLSVTLPSQNPQQIPLPVPPVPPNPEKDALLRALSQALVAQTHQTVSSNLSALPALQSQQSALQTAYHNLQSESSALSALDAALANNEKILQGAMHEADRVMADAKRRKIPDVDDVLVAPTIVGGQLYTLAAEEKGIGDVLFVLGRALDGGRVGVEGFVKQTRALAREQFLKKALIKKIAKGMALDEYQMR